MNASHEEMVQESLLGEWLRVKVLPLFTQTPKLSITQGVTLLLMIVLLRQTLNAGTHLIWDLFYLMLVILDGVETTYFISKKNRNCYPIVFVGWVATIVTFSMYLFYH